MAIATSAPVGVAQAVVLGGRGQAAGRPHELAARDRRDLLVGQVTTGKASSPVSSGRRSGSRPAGPSAAAVRISSSGVASSSVNGPDAVRVRAPR